MGTYVITDKKCYPAMPQDAYSDFKACAFVDVPVSKIYALNDRLNAVSDMKALASISHKEFYLYLIGSSIPLLSINGEL